MVLYISCIGYKNDSGNSFGNQNYAFAIYIYYKTKYKEECLDFNKYNEKANIHKKKEKTFTIKNHKNKLLDLTDVFISIFELLN